MRRADAGGIGAAESGDQNQTGGIGGTGPGRQLGAEVGLGYQTVHTDGWNRVNGLGQTELNKKIGWIPVGRFWRAVTCEPTQAGGC